MVRFVILTFPPKKKKKERKGKLHSSAEIFTAVIWVRDCKNNEIKTVCSVSYVLFKPHGLKGATGNAFNFTKWKFNISGENISGEIWHYFILESS